MTSNDSIDKKSLSERDICTKFITPAIQNVKRVEQLLSLCDALEARLQSAEEERGRLAAAVLALSTVEGMSTVGS